MMFRNHAAMTLSSRCPKCRVVASVFVFVFLHCVDFGCLPKTYHASDQITTNNKNNNNEKWQTRPETIRVTRRLGKKTLLIGAYGLRVEGAIFELGFLLKNFVCRVPKLDVFGLSCDPQEDATCRSSVYLANPPSMG